MLQNPKYNSMNYLSNILAINSANGSTTLPQLPIIGATQSSNTESDLDETQFERLTASTSGKSFTIASILGLKKKNTVNNNLDVGNSKQKELNAMNLSIHNNRTYSMQTKPLNGNSGIEADNRLGQNRMSMVFPTLQGSRGYLPPPSHFFPTINNNPINNNNNNLNTVNHNGNNNATALQNLQQFHSKNSQNFPTFHGKEHRNKNEHTVKTKSAMKSKRVRTIFTPEQLERLEAEFERQQYMVGPERLYLAHTLQLTEAQVKVWFQNRRIKWRKHHLEMNQQRLAMIRQHQVQPSPADARNNGVEKAPSSTSPVDFDNSTPVGNQSRDLSELSICTDSMASVCDSDQDVNEL